LATALARTEGEETLLDLRAPLEEMYAEAGRRLGEQQARDHADRMHADFLRLRDEALFHGMDSLSPGLLLTGMDPEANRKAAPGGAPPARGGRPCGASGCAGGVAGPGPGPPACPRFRRPRSGPVFTWCSSSWPTRPCRSPRPARAATATRCASSTGRGRRAPR